MKFGLLGERLGHSYSPGIHKDLHGYEYALYEVQPEELGDFLASTDLDGMNVTIPYKRAVVPFCAEISDAARRIGCVNTLVKRKDGFFGHNTDYDGFIHMVRESGIGIDGRKVLILGSGGASLAARAALLDLGASDVVVISRSARSGGEILGNFPGGDFSGASPSGDISGGNLPGADIPGNFHGSDLPSGDGLHGRHIPCAEISGSGIPDNFHGGDLPGSGISCAPSGDGLHGRHIPCTDISGTGIPDDFYGGDLPGSDYSEGFSVDPSGGKSCIRHDATARLNPSLIESPQCPYTALIRHDATARLNPSCIDPPRSSYTARIRFDTYGRLNRHADAEIIVNTTPVGMYPDNGASPVDLRLFPSLCGVFDVVYNPKRTALLLQAETLGLPFSGGLGMLVAQALHSARLWLGGGVSDEKSHFARIHLERDMRNIILVGMPGSGKTSIGKALAKMTGRRFVDTDSMVEKEAGRSIPEIFRTDGEAAFRALETEAVSVAGKESGLVIATGGGVVVKEENYPLLHQNGRIFWIQRDLDALTVEGRPLSASTGIGTLYSARQSLYEMFADEMVMNDSTIELAAQRILDRLK